METSNGSGAVGVPPRRYAWHFGRDDESVSLEILREAFHRMAASLIVEHERLDSELNAVIAAHMPDEHRNEPSSS